MMCGLVNTGVRCVLGRLRLIERRLSAAARCERSAFVCEKLRSHATNAAAAARDYRSSAIQDSHLAPPWYINDCIFI
jgi:hypothetical protein